MSRRTPVEIEDPAERPRICRQVLAALPGWFGLPEANARYERDVADLPTFAIGADAFISLRLHTTQAAEVYVMGVRPELHRRGFGTALLEVTEENLRARGVEFFACR